MPENIEIKIERDSIQSIIEAKVQTAVMEALLPHKEKFVEALVDKALLTKSKDSSYNYTKKDEIPTVLEHMVRTIIAEEARAAITEWAKSHREEIGEAIRKKMATKAWGKKAAYHIAEQMATCHDYNFTLVVKPTCGCE